MGQLRTSGAKTEETAELVALPSSFPSSSPYLSFPAPCYTILYKYILCFTLSHPPIHHPYPHITPPHPHFSFSPLAILFYTLLCYDSPSPLVLSLLLAPAYHSSSPSHPFPAHLLYHTIHGCAMPYPLRISSVGIT